MKKKGIALDKGLLKACEEEFKILEFIIENEKYKSRFCINVDEVVEVTRFTKIVTVPHSHSAITGIADIRGTIIPVINLGYCLGIKEKYNKEDKIIITSFNHKTVGFMVDDVVRIHRVEPSKIKDYASITDLELSNLLLSVIEIDGRLIYLIDFQEVIANIGGLI